MGERRFGIVRERAAPFEPGAFVEAVGGVEQGAVAGFEADSAQSGIPGQLQEFAKHRPADPAAERMGSGPHRFHLAMVRRDCLERANPQQGPILVAKAEKADVRAAKAVQRKHVAGLRRRIGAHLREMESQQAAHVVAVELVFVKDPLHRFDRKPWEAAPNPPPYARSMLMRTIDEDGAWAAFERRDRSWDGRVIGAVRTTGIYCKPSCPARRPKRENVMFYATAEDARAAGYRPCLRCKPDETGRDREAVAIAVERIEGAEDAPTLAQLAAEVGYAPHHFQRLFKRDVGLSPAEYWRALRARRAQRALGEGGTVTDAIYDSGYSGPSRFYADSKERLGMTPSAWRDGGRGETIRYVVTDSPLGPLLIAATSRGICRLTFGEDESALRKRFPNADIRPDDGTIRPWVEGALRAIETPFDAPQVPVDVRGTVFQEKVWKALRDIPAGDTRSYADIAAAVGQPGAVRAVGTANGSNPVSVLVPCHRVIRSDGSLGGYGGGLDNKKKLLAAEGVKLTLL